MYTLSSLLFLNFQGMVRFKVTGKERGTLNHNKPFMAIILKLISIF